jgi:hypothetical protein
MPRKENDVGQGESAFEVSFEIVQRFLENAMPCSIKEERAQYRAKYWNR